MPATFVQLLLFVIFLVPGFLHYVQRRSRVPQRSLSPLVEAATLGTVSLVTNAITLGVFAVVRLFLGGHSPEPRRVFEEGLGYTGPRLGYSLVWFAGLVAMSCVIAFVLGARPGPVAWLAERFAPAIVDVSAWYHVFDEGPVGKRVYVGCDLEDRSYVGGFLDWYSTDVEETDDRDFVLAEPITFRPPDDVEDRTIQEFSRLVISARDVRRLYVSYVDPESAA